jgi:very-short-patch-repair endonuclease
MDEVIKRPLIARTQVQLAAGSSATKYRRDRRKDQLLQENGYLVLRYLAEDLAKELDSVLDGILRSLSARRKPGSMAIPITVVRGSRV